MARTEHAIPGNDRRPYPQLERLCIDFGLQVTQPGREKALHPKGEGYTLMDRQGGAARALTPVFPSMAQLEQFVAENLVDVLHTYFFGEARSA